MSACHENVVCSSADISLGNLAPCTQKEAVTRLLLHAADCVKQEHSIIIIRTSDTDMVVPAISLSQQLGAKELCTSFETGKHFRYIAIHGIASKLGPDKCKALPVFHAITGCDTVSSIAGRGKLKAWEVWMAFPPVTQAFLKLAACKEETAASTPETLEHFIALVYPRNSPYAGVNEARKKTCFQKETDPLKTFLPHQLHSVNMCYEQHTKGHSCGASAWRKNPSFLLLLPGDGKKENNIGSLCV